jgi:hypothetical protein
MFVATLYSRQIVGIFYAGKNDSELSEKLEEARKIQVIANQALGVNLSIFRYDFDKFIEV